jgi:rhamnosyltransferase
VFNENTLDYIEEFYIQNLSIANSYSAIVFNSKNISNLAGCDGTCNKFTFRDVMMAINSGSLYYLGNLKMINWHNESYFVDGVDYEFCLRSKKYNLKIGECSLAPGFDHKSEQGDDTCEIFGKVCQIRKYPMSRIIDVAFSGVKLFVISIKTMNFYFAIKIGQLLVGYLAYQLLARINNCFGIIKRTTK